MHAGHRTARQREVRRTRRKQCRLVPRRSIERSRRDDNQTQRLWNITDCSRQAPSRHKTRKLRSGNFTSRQRERTQQSVCHARRSARTYLASQLRAARCAQQSAHHLGIVLRRQAPKPRSGNFTSRQRERAQQSVCHLRWSAHTHLASQIRTERPAQQSAHQLGIVLRRPPRRRQVKLCAINLDGQHAVQVGPTRWRAKVLRPRLSAEA